MNEYKETVEKIEQIESSSLETMDEVTPLEINEDITEMPEEVPEPLGEMSICTCTNSCGSNYSYSGGCTCSNNCGSNYSKG